MSATSLSKLISTRKEELAKLWELRGTNFPAVERQKDLRISFIELELADLEKLNRQPQLNENQQIVLDWLKNLYGCHYYQPFVAVSLFRHSFWTEKIEENYNQLDRKQQAQVLEVFSRWAQEQEE